MRRSRTIITGAAVALYAALLLWYGGRGAPLTPAEVDAGLSRIEAVVRERGRTPMPELLAELRTVLAGDDGDEFVMVNLIRYRKKAVYPAGSTHGDDPLEADARYNRAVGPELLRRGCVPVLLGRVAGRFIHPEGSDDWDAVALVRYRSRRDLLDMALSLVQKDGDVHKWASVEKTQIFPVKVALSLVTIRLMTGALLGAAALSVLALVERKRGRDPHAAPSPPQ